MGKKQRYQQRSEEAAAAGASHGSSSPPVGLLYGAGIAAVAAVGFFLYPLIASATASDVLPHVSIITPTSHARHAFHSRLYDSFRSQTYPADRIELLVYDDAPTASPFFVQLMTKLNAEAAAAPPTAPAKPRVRYIHFPRSGLSIGRKRNHLIEASTSEVIAHFDDDDYYAPGYVLAMVKRLQHQNADLTNLSGWYLYSKASNFFGYWNQTRDSALFPAPFHPGSNQPIFESGKPISIHVRRGLAQVREMVFQVDEGAVLGYGFSYVYRKSFWADAGKFPDSNQSEDIDLVRAGRKASGGSAVIDHFADTQALCLKFLHRQASSSTVSQYSIPIFALPQIFGDRVLPYIDGAP